MIQSSPQKHTAFGLFHLLLFGGILFLLVGCQGVEKKRFQNQVLLWHAPQESIQLNAGLEWKADFQADSLTVKDLPTLLASTNKKTNTTRDLLFLGPRFRYPNGWFRLKVYNALSTPQTIVIDEDNHIRCDALQAYTIYQGKLHHWGKVHRNDRLYTRIIPYFTYAIPITIPAKDTVDVIIHTQRNYGVHEINLSASTYATFLQKTIQQFFTRVFELVIVIFCFLIMITVGWLFRDRAMILLGVYIASITLSLVTFPGFLDSFIPNWPWGFQKSGLLAAMPFLMNILYHPYGLEIMKDVPKNETLFKRFSYGIMLINGMAFSLYFLPLTWFQYVENILPRVYVIFSSFSIFWLFFSAIIAYYRAKMKYFLLAVCFTLLPFVFEQIIGVFASPETMISFKITRTSFILTLLGVSIISIYQLRNKLVSRKKHENQLAHVKSTMEEIRSGEIQAVGRNLHDNVGNILASALGYLNLKDIPILTVQSVLHEAIREIRFLSHNLVKNESLPISLKLARLTERFDEFSSADFYFQDYTQKGIDRQLSEDRQQNLYYIVQELFTNIIKHAFAKEVSVQIFQDEDRSWITIEDDGVGWEVNSQAAQGIGLKNMYQRANLAQFIITLDATTQGTNVIIEIPNENNLPNH